MLRKFYSLEDGIDVVLSDEIGDDGSAVVGFVRNGEGVHDKALCRIYVADTEVEGDTETIGLSVAPWDVADGFTEDELQRLMLFVARNIGTLHLVAHDREVVEAMQCIE